MDKLLTSLISAGFYVEAALDFPDEEVDFLADNEVTHRLEQIKSQLSRIFQKHGKAAYCVKVCI